MVETERSIVGFRRGPVVHFEDDIRLLIKLEGPMTGRARYPLIFCKSKSEV